MQNGIFKKELERLNQNFPKWVVTGEMESLLYKKLKHVPSDIFSKIVDDILLNVTSMKVKLSDFEDRLFQYGGHIRSIRRSEEAHFSEPTNLVSCKHCVQSGYVSTVCDGFSYVFKCFCKNGRERQDDFPVWGSKYRDVGHKNIRLEEK